MSDTAHSWFPPSAAARTIRCPASLKLAAQLEDKSGVHAEMGTECHTAMQQSAVIGVPAWTKEQFTDPDTQMELCQIAWDALTTFMSEHNIKEINPEVVVNMQQIGFPDIFGTCDVLAYVDDEKRLFVIDYKFGYNAVDPYMNEQLMMYALGALADYPETTEVVITVIQPKESKDPMTWVTKPDVIKKWAKDDLLKAIHLSRLDDAPFNPGEVQCKYCPVAKVGCEYQTKHYLQAIEDFHPAQAFHLSDEKLTRYLVMIPAMKDAIKAVETAAVARLKSGGMTDSGFKLVERKTNRRWVDTDKAIEWLKSKRFKQDEYLKTSVVSPAAAEKLVKKRRFKTTAVTEFKELIEKPTGELTYAPDKDRRKEISINEQGTLIDALLDDLL